MRGLFWHGVRDLRIRSTPDPTDPAPGWVTLRVDLCGICGTDLEEYRAGPRVIPTKEPHPVTHQLAPLILGHEITGTVVARGYGVTQLEIGARVSVDNSIFCSTCSWCRRGELNLCSRAATIGLQAHGGLADFVSAPAYTCLRIPDDMRAEDAALVEPTAVAVHSVRRAGEVEGAAVVIFGAGAIGLLVLQCALHSGASAAHVVEPNPFRADMALELGARSASMDAGASMRSALDHLGAGDGADVAFECSGHALAEALTATRRGGQVVVVGASDDPVSLRLPQIVGAERRITGAVGHLYDIDTPEAIRLIATKALRTDCLISDVVELDDAITGGFVRLEQDPNLIKLLVAPR